MPETRNFSVPDTPEGFNYILTIIHNRLNEDKALAKGLQFSLQRKSERPRQKDWAKTYKYSGPDPETTSLLDQFREAWTGEPVSFVVGRFGAPTGYGHPVVQTVSCCIYINRLDAWSTILRRCYCVILSRLQKRYTIPAEIVARQIIEFESQSFEFEDLVHQVEHLQEAGSRYECLQQSLGVGVIFVLGQDVANDV